MPAKSKLTTAEKENMRTLYAAGITTKEIAKRYGISWYYAKKIIDGYEGGAVRVYTGPRKPAPAAGITFEMIAEVRRRLRPGTTVICLDKSEEGHFVKKQRCKVIDKSRHLFTVKRPGGTESFTYVDLIRHYGVMEDERWNSMSA